MDRGRMERLYGGAHVRRYLRYRRGLDVPYQHVVQPVTLATSVGVARVYPQIFAAAYTYTSTSLS